LRYPCQHAMRFLSRKQLGTLLFFLLALGTVYPQTLSGMPLANQTAEDPLMGSGFSSLPAPSRSYFLGGVHVSTGAESNPSLLSTYSSQISSVTNLLGDFSLRKFWRHFETSVDYTGGDTLYRGYGDQEFTNQQFQRFSADGVIRWKGGQLSLKELFTYTGSRGFGSSSPGGIGNPTNPGSEFFGAAVFAPSYLGNVTVVSVAEALSRRSSVSFSAAYSFNDYINSEGLFNSRQASMQTGYTYQISRRNNIGVIYGYQDFQFIPNVQSVVTNSAQFVFERHFSDRIDLVLGAGPDRIVTTGIISTQSQINTTGQASLMYRRRKSGLNFSYFRLVTSGSGVYAGGLSDTATISIDRRVSRSWQATLRGSYDRASGLGVSSFGAQLPQSKYWLAGVTVHRRLGRSLSAFASYEFNNDSFLTCAGFQRCGPAANRNAILTGFDWSIRPVHLE